MKPTWKQIYPWIKTAVHNLESIDALLRQTVERVAEVYQADCLLWAGLESDVVAPYVYGTAGAVQRWAFLLGTPNSDNTNLSSATSAAQLLINLPTYSGEAIASEFQSARVQQFRPRSLPLWLLDQQYNPQLIQLETGDLIVPVTTRGSNLAIEVQQGGGVTNTLQFVLQLSRPIVNPAAIHSATYSTTNYSTTNYSTANTATNASVNRATNHSAMNHSVMNHSAMNHSATANDVVNSAPESYGNGATRHGAQITEAIALTPILKPPLLDTELQEHEACPDLWESYPSVTNDLSTSTFPRRVYAASEQMPFQGWDDDELESLEIAGSQLGLAYSALYWRQRLEQSRQQAGLIGRIARLLNSTLNPDEIVGRIVAELGYGLQCDRSILVDLRQELVRVLAIWDHADRPLRPLEQHQVHRDYWQNVIEMFLHGGASYLEIGLNQPDPDSLKDWLQEIGASSVLLVPLHIQEEFFGAVALLSYQQERTYLLDELQTVRQAADQAAIALTNARTYQSLKQNQEVLRLQNHSLRLEVMRDELTQLLNRRALERELEHLSLGTIWTVQQPFSIVVCDIDHFKQINDSYGHLIGDEVLYSLAQRLQHQLRRETPIYRYGGEEFVVVLPETLLQSAVEVAERLRQIIRTNPIRTKDGLIQVTASFGVAQQNLNCDRSAWDILQRADQALYEAKHQGRNQVRSLTQSR